MNRRQKQLLRNIMLVVSVFIISSTIGIKATGIEKRNREIEASSGDSIQLIEKAEANVVSEEKYGPNVQYEFAKRKLALSSKERYLLAKIAMAEAEGESLKGKALVMMVVLNRVWDENFPNTIEDVIYQEKQFSPISDGRWEKVEPDADCWKALQMIQEDCWDESQGALYFESNSESNWHRNNLKYLFKHGNHYFYTDKE